MNKIWVTDYMAGDGSFKGPCVTQEAKDILVRALEHEYSHARKVVRQMRSETETVKTFPDPRSLAFHEQDIHRWEQREAAVGALLSEVQDLPICGQTKDLTEAYRE